MGYHVLSLKIWIVSPIVYMSVKDRGVLLTALFKNPVMFNDVLTELCHFPAAACRIISANLFSKKVDQKHPAFGRIMM